MLDINNLPRLLGVLADDVRWGERRGKTALELAARHSQWSQPLPPPLNRRNRGPAPTGLAIVKQIAPLIRDGWIEIVADDDKARRKGGWPGPERTLPYLEYRATIDAATAIPVGEHLQNARGKLVEALPLLAAPDGSRTDAQISLTWAIKAIDAAASTAKVIITAPAVTDLGPADRDNSRYAEPDWVIATDPEAAQTLIAQARDETANAMRAGDRDEDPNWNGDLTDVQEDIFGVGTWIDHAVFITADIDADRTADGDIRGDLREPADHDWAVGYVC